MRLEKQDFVVDETCFLSRTIEMSIPRAQDRWKHLKDRK